MQVLVNSDRHITSSESVSERVESIVLDAIERYADRITRVEAHLSDVNGPKHGDRDKRCMLEAHIAGAAPVAVTNQAPTLLEAIEGASDKLERALEHTFGRLATTQKGPREEDTATVEELTALERDERQPKRNI